MNQGFGHNSYGHYGNPIQQPPFGGMFQQRQPCLGPWNTHMGGNYPPGRFASPQHFHPRGSFSGRGRPPFNARPQMPNYQPRHNFNQNTHDGKHVNKQFQHGKKHNQKKKVDKRDLPENNKYFCDTCDRGFCSEEKLLEHVNCHEKCSDPTCSYVAAPKLVKLHFQMHHKTGLAGKIWKLESPEEIKRWIENRKRNYPTVENIERKKSLQTVKDARGEKLDTKYFGKMRGGHSHNNRGGGRNRKRQFERYGAQNGDEHSPAKKLSSETSEQPLCSTTGSGNGDPLSAILQQPHSESEVKTDSEAPPGGVSVAGGLASLMATYSDSEDDSPESAPIQHNKNPSTSQVETSTAEPRSVDHSTNNRTHKQKRNQKKKKCISQTFNTKKPTLLERLLANEIRHERNVLLQCVHYIVKKKFFGVDMDGKKNSIGS